jgi:hypothetical protein
LVSTAVTPWLDVIGDGVSPETADAWIVAWEAQAAQNGLERGFAYWQAGWDWIAESGSVESDPSCAAVEPFHERHRHRQHERHLDRSVIGGTVADQDSLGVGSGRR